MAAEAIANYLGLSLLRVDLSTVVSKYIGETEKNLRRIFDTAESGGSILFFDEADALFGKRSEVRDSHDRYANIEVGYLLQRLEQYHGLAILATNMRTALDPAFTRRIRFIVKFPFPDESSRAQIWKRIFPKFVPVKDLNIMRLARLNITGGNIRNIALNAAFLAAERNTSVDMTLIAEATKFEYEKMGKPLTLEELGERGG
jgi:SpoVK/Ycf46/Vps4 family AAA+-type ATPase